MLSTIKLMKTYIFKISLMDDKKTYRKIEVLENINLYKLAQFSVNMFDFDFDHCFGFFSNLGHNYFDSKEKYELFADLKDVEPTDAKSVKKTKINDVWEKPKDKMLLLFDYGDSWEFEVELLEIKEQEEKGRYPRLLELKGVAPEQYPDCD